MTLEDQAPPAQASAIDVRESDVATVVVPVLRDVLSDAVRRGDIELARNLTAKTVRAIQHGVTTSRARDGRIENRLVVPEVWF